MGINNPPSYIPGPAIIVGPLTVNTGPITLGSGQFLAPDGTIGAPSYSFSSDPNTGFYRAAADTVRFTTGGVDRLQITNAGNVQVASTALFLWSSGLVGASSDTQISRAAAGSFTFSNASTNSFTVTAGASGLATFGASIQAVGNLTAANSTAIPAGGTTGVGLKFSSTANFGVFFGSGAPTLSAAKGSLYLRSDGSGIGDRAYVNTDGATAWTAITTAT